jgi:hypothetical protein
MASVSEERVVHTVSRPCIAGVMAVTHPELRALSAYWARLSLRNGLTVDKDIPDVQVTQVTKEHFRYSRMGAGLTVHCLALSGSTHICGVKTALIPILIALLIKSGSPILLLGAFWQSSGAKACPDPTILRRPISSSVSQPSCSHTHPSQSVPLYSMSIFQLAQPVLQYSSPLSPDLAPGCPRL